MRRLTAGVAAGVALHTGCLPPIRIRAGGGGGLQPPSSIYSNIIAFHLQPDLTLPSGSFHVYHYKFCWTGDFGERCSNEVLVKGPTAQKVVQPYVPGAAQTEKQPTAKVAKPYVPGSVSTAKELHGRVNRRAEGRIPY